ALAGADDGDGPGDLTFLDEALEARPDQGQFRRVEVGGSQGRECAGRGQQHGQETKADGERGSHGGSSRVGREWAPSRRRRGGGGGPASSAAPRFGGVLAGSPHIWVCAAAGAEAAGAAGPAGAAEAAGAVAAAAVVPPGEDGVSGPETFSIDTRRWICLIR